VNLSITSSIVPDELKSLRVKPLLLTNNRADVDNYRQVKYTVDYFYKIRKKTVYQQLQKY